MQNSSNLFVSERETGLPIEGEVKPEPERDGKATERSEGGSPILVKRAPKSGIDLGEIERDLRVIKDVFGADTPVLFRKCACNSSWCPTCGRKELLEMLFDVSKKWDRRRVRPFSLTLDRDLYSSGEEAYFEIQRKKELAEFMKRVKRGLKKEGLQIVDWFWILEWHDDGYPHWHYYVLVNKKGKAGRINQKVNLTEAWGRAKHVEEGYIKDLNHWEATLGYAAKHGYFSDGKKKQAILPDWAKALHKEGPNKIRIKRHERMRNPLKGGRKSDFAGMTPAQKKAFLDFLNWFDGSLYHGGSGEFERPIKDEKTRTWKEVLDSCGAQSLMTIICKRFLLTVRINFPYKKVKKLPGSYVEGKGYVADLGVDQIMKLLEKEEELICYKRSWFV